MNGVHFIVSQTWEGGMGYAERLGKDIIHEATQDAAWPISLLDSEQRAGAAEQRSSGAAEYHSVLRYE